MPFALITIGLILIVTGARDTYRQFGTMVAADMTGSNGGAGFIYFAAAIGGVGALGAIEQLKTFSHVFMALILISLILNNSGVFAKLTQALQGAKNIRPGAALPNTQPATAGGQANALPSIQGATQLLNGLY